MPSCCVPACKSRTGAAFVKKVKYFRFPKDPILLDKWLTACGKTNEYNVTFATVCEIHFPKDCFVFQSVKSRASNVSPKWMLKLKKNSVPSLLLNLSSKRKPKADSVEVLAENEVRVSPEIPLHGDCVKNIKELQEKNIALQKLVNELKIALGKKNNDIQTMQKNMYKERIEYTKSVLGQIFTKSQITKVMSLNKVRVRWSTEDIISAITLHSMSSEAYKYLRNIKKMPLPSESTLNKWFDSFNEKSD